MKLIDILVEELPKRGGWPKRANCITQDGDLKVEPALCHPSIAKCDEDGFWFLDSSRTGGFEVDTLASDYTTAIITREQYEAALAAKNDGWIEWGGGECPVPCGTMVDVKHRCGAVSENQQAWTKHRKKSDVMVNPLSNAGQAFWRHENSVMDIVAYRLHQPQEAEQVKADDEADLNECIGQDIAQVWSGEGLPPVGCECEYTKESLPGNEWTQCTVDYVGASFVVYRDCYGVELTGIIGDIKFRPIRSEAEQKRDEAVKAIDRYMPEFIPDTPNDYYNAKKIYDAIAAGKIPGVKLDN